MTSQPAQRVQPRSSVARVQQILGGVLLVALIACVFMAWRSWAACAPDVTGWSCLPWPWGACALGVLVLHPVVMALQFALALHINRQHGQPCARGRAVWAVWWGEVGASVRIFGLQQPWLWRHWPDTALARVSALQPAHASRAEPMGPVGQGACARRPLVLVHGFMCNRGLWTVWLQALTRQGVVFTTVNLEPMLGSIDDHATQIENAVQRAHAAAGGIPPVVVAHSMGGLAVRAWMRATPGADRRVARVITVGTPHNGTWLARWGYGQNARQMRLASPWLAALAAAEPAERRALFTCWHSCGDNIVFPHLTATLPGADNRHMAAVGHVALLDQPEVLAHVLHCLNGG